TERTGALARKLFKRFLDVRVYRERNHLAALRASYCLIGCMRREHRHWTAAAMHHFGLRKDDFVGGYPVCLRDAIKHTIAGALCKFRRAVGTSRFGRLRDSDKQCRLTKRELSRLLAKIGMRRGAHALEIAAVRRKREIERED